MHLSCSIKSALVHTKHLYLVMISRVLLSKKEAIFFYEQSKLFSSSNHFETISLDYSLLTAINIKYQTLKF